MKALGSARKHIKTNHDKNLNPRLNTSLMYQHTTDRLLRIFRRAVLLIAAILIPIYAVSLSEQFEVPAQWREIAVGDGHAQVREKLRASGMGDTQCEWRGFEQSVRCTLMGQHHACGLAVRFDGPGDDAQVDRVKIHEPSYTGPFHTHARLRRKLNQIDRPAMR